MNNNYFETNQVIKLSLLKKYKDFDSSTNKAEFLKVVSNEFKYDIDILHSVDFETNEEFFSLLLSKLYNDLLDKAKDKEYDHLALFINIVNQDFENSIYIQTLEDITKYSDKEINPILEFYKMTLGISNTENN